MKITIDNLRKLIREQAYRLLELDVVDDSTAPEENPEFTDDAGNDLNDVPEFGEKRHTTEPSTGEETSIMNAEPESEKVVDYSNLSPSIKRLSEKISPAILDSLIREITTILEKGRGKHTHENSIKTKPEEIEYITSVLGTLYKTASDTEKKNIRNYMFVAFNPYINGQERISTLGRMVGRKAGIEADLRFNQTIDADYYTSIIAESIYESIDYCLNNYNPESTSFGRFLWLQSARTAINKIKSKRYKTAFTGYGKSSLDEPIGDEEDSETGVDRLTSDEKEVEKEKKEGATNLLKALSSFVEEKLSVSKKYENYLEFFKLFTEGNNIQDIAEITGKSDNNLRVIKLRLETFLNHFVESGELQMYIKDKTGIKVNFPDNKFSLSGKKEKNLEVEPVFIFQPNKKDPENGGEWVQITPDKGEPDTSWFEGYGKIAFGDEEKETEPVINGINNEEEPLTEDGSDKDKIYEVRKSIRSVLEKYLF